MPSLPIVWIPLVTTPQLQKLVKTPSFVLEKNVGGQLFFCPCIWEQDSVIILNFNGLNASFFAVVLYHMFPIFSSFLLQKVAEIIIFDENDFKKREMYQKFKSPLRVSVLKKLENSFFWKGQQWPQFYNCSSPPPSSNSDFFWNSLPLWRSYTKTSSKSCCC